MKDIGKVIVDAVAMCIFFCVMCFSNDLKEIILCGTLVNVFMMLFIYELKEQESEINDTYNLYHACKNVLRNNREL